jgi:hypothetical protein
MKICALLIPKELKVETVGRIGQLTDELLDQAIAVLEEMIDRKAGERANCDRSGRRSAGS